jgi:uncharacterized protein (DUF2336 family)
MYFCGQINRENALANPCKASHFGRMSNFALSAADVQKLLADPSEAARAETVNKLANDLESHTLNPDERKMAEDILRLLARDAALAVRSAIVESMKSSRQLPTDVAEQLAKDVEALSLPLLQSSPVLSDPFLVAMVRQSDGAKQAAIATRPQVSNSLASTLVEVGAEEALAKLAANPGADLAEHNIAYMLERFPQSNDVAAGLVQRPQVPARIMEYLVATASDALRAKIQARTDYQGKIGDLMDQSRERATMRMLGRGRSDKELLELAHQLNDAGRLTASLVLRALCMGDLQFFEVALAVSAKVPVKNARALIHDQGDAGLDAIYGRSTMFSNVLPAIRHALEIARETNFDGGADDLNRYRRRLMERILTDPRGMSAEDIEYLLDKLSDLDGNSP